MIASLIIAGIFTFVLPEGTLEDWMKIALGALITTIIWVVSTYLTPPTSDETLVNFYQKIAPGGPGWNHVKNHAATSGIELKEADDFLGLELACAVIGVITVFAALFATGNFIYGHIMLALVMLAFTCLGGYFLFWAWSKMHKT